MQIGAVTDLAVEIANEPGSPELRGFVGAVELTERDFLFAANLTSLSMPRWASIAWVRCVALGWGVTSTSTRLRSLAASGSVRSGRRATWAGTPGRRRAAGNRDSQPSAHGTLSPTANAYVWGAAGSPSATAASLEAVDALLDLAQTAIDEAPTDFGRQTREAGAAYR